MLRIFCLIFSVLVLFPQLSFSSTDDGDFGGGNEQGNAGKGEFCKKYNICIGKVSEANSLSMAVSDLHRLKTADFGRYQSLQHFVFNYPNDGQDYEIAMLLRNAFAVILSEDSLNSYNL